jgi:hypothetical protein
MDNAALIKETLEKETGIVFQDIPSLESLQIALTVHINDLIVNNFEKLIYILYRIDISEKLIKQLLQEATDTSAGETIAKAIIERQLHKITLRQTFTQPSDIDCDEEKW